MFNAEPNSLANFAEVLFGLFGEKIPSEADAVGGLLEGANLVERIGTSSNFCLLKNAAVPLKRFNIVVTRWMNLRKYRLSKD